jgi:hypothetical protein
MTNPLEQIRELAKRYRRHATSCGSLIYENCADDLESILASTGWVCVPVEQKVWRCFYCDEVFTDSEQAALHFGTQMNREAACKIDIAEYRRMEAKSELYRDEDAAIHREMRGMENEHQRALRPAEEDGYAKGLIAAATGERYG